MMTALRRFNLLMAGAVVASIAGGCGPDASNEVADATLASSEVSLVEMSAQQRLVNAYEILVVGLTSNDRGLLRQALCASTTSDVDIDRIHSALAEIPDETRLTEVRSTVISQQEGAARVMFFASVGGMAGEADVELLAQGVGCVRVLDADGGLTFLGK